MCRLKTWLFFSCAKFTSQANSFGIYWLKLLTYLLTNDLLNMAYLLNFIKRKSISATFLCWKITNGRNGSNSYLTQAKLLKRKKAFTVVKKVCLLLSLCFHPNLDLQQVGKTFHLIMTDSFINYNSINSHCPKKWNFSLRIYSVNMTKSAVYGRFGGIYWKKP